VREQWPSIGQCTERHSTPKGLVEPVDFALEDGLAEGRPIKISLNFLNKK
jgi:hypothetical protein